MKKLEQVLWRVYKTDRFVFDYFKEKLERNTPEFFDNLDRFCDMARVPLPEYTEILREEYYRFMENHNGMDLS